MDGTRELGALDARLGGLESDVTEIKSDVKLLLARDAARAAILTAWRGYVIPGAAVVLSVLALARS